MSKKLTAAQELILSEVNKQGSARVISTYKPAVKLIELGLVKAEYEKYGMVTIKRIN